MSYDKLIEELRDKHIEDRYKRLTLDAADAIENLQAEEKSRKENCEKCADATRRVITDLQGIIADLRAQLPKMAEIVRCGECIWYDPLDRTRPFFCPVMDCATGVMEDDFCSRGERRAKMEVQDGK